MNRIKIRKNKQTGNVYAIRFNESNHTYHVSVNSNPEVKYPSVTTLTKAFGADDKVNRLIYWALNLALNYLKEELDGYSSVSYAQFLALLKEAKHQHKKELTRTGNIGTAVHAMVETLLGEDESVADGLIEKVSNPDNELHSFFVMFSDWTEGLGFYEILETEGFVFHPEFEYCGKFDLLCRDGEDKIFLVDFKTRKDVRKEDKLQLAAYIRAYEACTGEKIDGAKLVRLPRDTQKRPPEVTVEDLEEHFNAFLACRYLSEWARVN